MIIENQKQKKADFKKHRARIHKGYFFTTVINSHFVTLFRASPETPTAKAKARAKMALAALVSFQKQKLTIVKPSSSQYFKSCFSEGE